MRRGLDGLLAFVTRFKFLFAAEVILFIIMQLERLYIFGFVFYPDELGYWYPAAKVLGFDWSQIYGLGSFYAKGYSIFLLPILHFFTDPISCYRAAIAVNVVMVGVSLIVVYRTINAMTLNISQDMVQLLSVVSILTPSFIFYSQTTLTESLCLLVYVVLIRMIQRLTFEKKALNKAFITFFILFLCIYSYMVHRRNLAIAAGVVVSLLWLFLIAPLFKSPNKKRNRKIFTVTFIAILIVAIIGGFYTFSYFNRLFDELSNGSADIANTFVAQVYKFRILFSAGGIRQLLISLVGKLFYITVYTYGIFWWGCAYLIKKIRQSFQEKESVLYLTVLLTGVFNILLITLFTINDYRGDTLIYGRYNETILPFFVVLGLIQILESEKKVVMIGQLITAVAMIFMGITCYFKAISAGLFEIEGYFTVGVSMWLQDQYQSTGHDIPGFYIQVIIYGVVAVSIVTILVILEKIITMPRKMSVSGATEDIADRGKRKAISYDKIWFMLFSVILIYQVCVALFQCSHYLHTFNKADYSDGQLTEIIQEELDENPDRRVIYVDENRITFVGLVQFQLRDISINVTTDLEGLSDTDLVIIDWYDPRREEVNALDGYQYEIVTSHLCLYYNE